MAASDSAPRDVTRTVKRRLEMGDAAPGTLSTIRRRGRFVAAVVVVAFLGLGVRLHQLQYVRGDEYRDLARRQHFHRVVTAANRGSIFDRSGNLLAVTVARPSLYADPSQIEDPYLAAGRIAGVLGRERETILRRLNSKGQFVWIARKLDPKLADKVMALGVKGLGIRKEATRAYPQGRVAAW